MASIEPGALSLRFGQRMTSDAPPDVAAFLRPRETSTSTATPSPASPRVGESARIGVLPGRMPVDLEGPLQIFLRCSELEIPAFRGDEGLPDLSSWCVRATTFGWIATVSPPRRAQGSWAVAQVLAGCLALALPGVAMAGEGAAPAAAAGVSVSTREPADELAVEAQPAPEPSPAPASGPASGPAPVSGPVSGPNACEPAGQGRDAVADAAWEGVDGFEVVLELKGGKALRGRVGAVQDDTFTLIEAGSGQVLVLAKSGVASLRVYVPPPIPSKSGVGMLVGGGILTTVGVPIFITGAVFLGICPSCAYLHLPMLLIGGGALGGGIPMIATGIRRRSAFNKAVEEHRLIPIVSRTREGWSGGIRLRF